MRSCRLLSPLAALVLAACGGPDVDVAPEPDIDTVSNEQLALSLSVARAPGGQKGLHGRLGFGDSRFTFETRRVSEAEEHEMLEAGGVPVSVRITDSSGTTVVLSVASHEIPAGWEEAVEPAALSDEELDRRARVARAVARLAPIIAAAQLPEGSEHDREALVNASGMVPTDLIRSDAGADEVSQSSTALGYTYKQYFTVWRKPLAIGIAEHSASRWKNYYYSGGTWRYYNTIQYCNHGGCPGGTGMTQKCGTWNSSGAYIGSSRSCDSFNSGYLVCGLWGHNHNCHDDTRTQRARVVYRSGLSSEPSWCRDNGCSSYAPTCR